MTNPNQSFECLIESLGYQGEGICRHLGQVVFVNHALPGEQVNIRIKKRRKNLAFAELLQVMTPSGLRVPPPCPHFGTCGGCAVQHMEYGLQKDFKRQTVSDNLTRIAKASVPVSDVIGMKEPYYYRNKTTWQLRQKNGQIEAGFYASGSHEVVPVSRCFIASKASNAARDAVVAWLKACADQGLFSKDLPIRQFVTRSNQAGDLLLILGADRRSLPLLDQLVAGLEKAVPRLAGVCAAAFFGDEEEADKEPVQVLHGSPFLHEKLLGFDFQISPLSFFQVNLEVCEALYEYALREAIQSPEDVLLDLYSGTGTISLVAASRCKEVAGIEYALEAVKDARKNALSNRINNASFYDGKAEEVLPGLLVAGFQPDAVILDPPRKGAHPNVLSAILKAQPQRVVYISCHPASQARDAAVLLEAGYIAVKSQPFDMFPQTAEIENVITFTRSAP